MINYLDLYLLNEPKTDIPVLVILSIISFSVHFSEMLLYQDTVYINIMINNNYTYRMLFMLATPNLNL